MIATLLALSLIMGFHETPPPDELNFPEYLPYIAWYFPEELVGEALQVMQCESQGHPEAVGGVGEVGLFQIYPRYWSYLLRPGESLHDPDVNVRIAAQLAQFGIERHGDPWYYWSCQPRKESQGEPRETRDDSTTSPHISGRSIRWY